MEEEEAMVAVLQEDVLTKEGTVLRDVMATASVKATASATDDLDLVILLKVGTAHVSVREVNAAILGHLKATITVEIDINVAPKDVEDIHPSATEGRLTKMVVPWVQVVVQESLQLSSKVSNNLAYQQPYKEILALLIPE